MTSFLYSDYACPWPTIPPEDKNLIEISYDWDLEPLIQFGEKIEYGCRDGRKFEKDFDLPSENATCGKDNIWVPESLDGQWSPCVSRK